MFSVPAVQGFALRHATIDNGVLCVWWRTGSRMLMLLEAVHYADTDVQFVAEIQRASSLLFQRTHETTGLPSFARPVNHFSSTELGRKLTWPSPWRAAICHIFFVRTDSQFANENSLDIFWTILSPHDLWIRNALRMVMSVRWENGCLVYFQALRAIP